MRGDDQNIEKYNFPARVLLIDGTVRRGLIYLRQGQRIMDLLCESRPFFALKTNKNVVLIGKANIVALEIVERDDFEAEKDLFPPFDWSDLERRSW